MISGNLNFAAKILMVFVIAAIGVIIYQTWRSIEQDKQLTLDAAQGSGLAIVRLLEEHAAQTMGDARRKLNSFADAIEQVKRPADIDPAFISRAVANSQHDSRFVTALQFVNLSGAGMVTSLDYAAFEADFADRTYIGQLLASPERKSVVLGPPFFRFYDNEHVVPLARNVHARYGIHLGLVSVDVNVKYLRAVYERVSQQAAARITLIGNLKTIVAEAPFEQAKAGRGIAASPLLEHISTTPNEGVFHGATMADGSAAQPTLHIYRKIEGFPLVVVYSRDLAGILADWQARTMERVAVSAASIILVCALTGFLLLQIRRLARTDASLRESNRKLSESEVKFVSLFQRSPVPLALSSSDGATLTEVNDSFLAQFGYERQEFCSGALAPAGLWQLPEQKRALLDRISTQHYIDQMEAQLLHKRGYPLTCHVSARIIAAGDEQLILYAPIDMTHQRAIEAEIREINTELEHRVTLRTEGLASANRELSETLARLTALQQDLLRAEKMAALGALVAGVAHELNTPIGNCVLISSTLEANYQALNDLLDSGRPSRAGMTHLVSEAQKGVSIMSRNLARAAQLIESFKQVAVDQSSNQRRRFNLAHFVGEVLATVAPMFKNKKIEVVTDLPAEIDMDSYPGALAQVLTNLVANAVLHAFDGRPDGTIRIDATLADGQIRLRLSDNGVGIVDEHIKRVFDPFFTTRLGKGGSGLGLHICYNLLNDVLGGKIELDSELHRGSTFKLTLPQCAPTLAQREPPR